MLIIDQNIKHVNLKVLFSWTFDLLLIFIPFISSRRFLLGFYFLLYQRNTLCKSQGYFLALLAITVSKLKIEFKSLPEVPNSASKKYTRNEYEQQNELENEYFLLKMSLL